MDAPPDGVTEILITASNIEVQKADGDSWQVVVPGPVEFDLVKLQGVEETLGEALLDPGQYGQVRLSIDKAQVTVQGQTLDARVPSGRLKIVGGFSLDAGGTTIVTLDFDAEKSVVIAGKRNVLIKPVIKMLTRRGDQPLKDAEDVGGLDDATVLPEETQARTHLLVELRNATEPADKERFAARVSMAEACWATGAE